MWPSCFLKSGDDVEMTSQLAVGTKALTDLCMGPAVVHPCLITRKLNKIHYISPLNSYRLLNTQFLCQCLCLFISPFHPPIPSPTPWFFMTGSATPAFLTNGFLFVSYLLSRKPAEKPYWTDTDPIYSRPETTHLHCLRHILPHSGV